MKCPQCQAENLADSRFCHSCATPLREATGSRTIKAATFEIRRGELFAERYEIIEELGAGGMGKVFKVFDHKVNEIVALKLIRPEIGANERAIERFKNELRCTRKIAHRNICRMYDLGEAGLYHYITMEHVAGEDLKRFIRRAGALTPAKAIAIARQVAEGLAEAHGLGVVHRDLKPQNIMIDQDGNSRIMDFGIARFVDVQNMTGSGVMIGTPEYMSPEQVDAVEVDGRSDLYALGVVLYEMVTAAVPFEGGTPLSIAMKHKLETPRNVREINAAVPPALAGIVSRCMEKDPALRFQSAAEVIAALDAAADELNTKERPAPVKAKARTAARTKPAPAPSRAPAAAPKKRAAGVPKFAFPLGAVLLTVLAAFVVFKVAGGRQAPPSAPVVEETAAAPERGIATDPGAQGQPQTKGNVPADRETAQTDLSARNKQPAAVKAAAPPVSKPTSSEAQPPATQPPPKSDASSGSADAAGLAMARVTAARSVAEREEGIAAGLFWKSAEAREKEGLKGISLKRYDEARAQFAVAERLFRLAVQEKTDERRVRELARFVEDLRKRAAVAPGAADRKKALAEAGEAEQNGTKASTAKDYEGAVRLLVQAAAAYQRMIL